MTELHWKHHTLIQALLSRGPLKQDEFHRIFKGLTGKTPGTHQQLFDEYLLRINKALSYAQFELRACRHQYDGEIYYGVVNNVSDEESKLGTKYSVPQIAFYKAIIEEIVQNATAHGSISNIDALNLRWENQVLTGTGSQSQDGHYPALRNFTMTQKDKTLQELLHDKWLNRTPDGNIGLGIRSFLDLRSWFRNNEVPSCEICNEAGVKVVPLRFFAVKWAMDNLSSAELCQNEACSVRIHQYCLKKMFSQHKGARVCARCGIPWQHKGPKAEAIEEDDEPTVTVTFHSQPPPGPKRKKLKANDAVESSASQPALPSLNLRRVTRSSSRS
ncbi:Non-structural maintenance of chromosomes element [Parasponia andersonii]|uniref:Non-structural maintenance of chromosomes element 1 homolog n=1 Tax=Parasponia andersonii TaxID=3476 RepID=A0A2P5CDP0_PARAD|nr:Non-structural maintenance of chromosomes element [Parasponia andersonii]